MDHSLAWEAGRLRRLASRLAAEIEEEERRPLPDSLRLRQLKRRKLAIKDELEFHLTGAGS